jgi:hypothetical protein
MKKTNKHPLTFFRESNEARTKLVKKSMGGPGSGMGSMYLNDLANEAMMSEPSTPPKSVPVNAYNIDSKYNNLIPRKSGKYNRDMMEQLERRSLQDQRIREQQNQHKKGGFVKNKKK